MDRLGSLLRDLLRDETTLRVEVPRQRRPREPVIVGRLPQPQLSIGLSHTPRIAETAASGLPHSRFRSTGSERIAI